MTGLDLFAPGVLPLLLLFGVRVSGVVLLAPLFSARTVPVTMRTGVVLLLVILMVPAIATPAALAASATMPAVVSELVVGLMIGLGAALLVGAAEVAGELLAIQVGLQGSAIVDPLSQQQTTALGQFLQLLAITLLLSLNAHTVMLQALKASVDLVPVGAGTHLREGLGAMMRLGTVLFALGLRFAAPVIAVILIVNVALAVLNRAAPQLQIMSVAFPVQILAGLSALIALVPLLGSWFFGWETAYDDLLGRVLPALRPGGIR